MSNYPKYLTKRKQGFYAVMEIPKALRPLFDMKPRFLQSLQTQDQSLRSVACLLLWRGGRIFWRRPREAGSQQV